MTADKGAGSANPPETFPEYFTLLSLCFDLSDTLIHSVEVKKYASLQHMGEYKLISAASLYKATDSVHSIHILLSKRMVGDAMVVCRRIIELSINLKYLQMDSEKRALQYWNYLTLSSKKLLTTVQNDKDYSTNLRRNLQKMRKDIERSFESAKPYYDLDESGNIPKRYLSSWSGKTIEQMAKGANLAGDYLYPYRYFSTSTHSSVVDLLHYFNVDSNSLGPNYPDSTILQVILQTVRSYLLIMDVVDESHQLGLSGSVSAVRGKLNEFKDDPRHS